MNEAKTIKGYYGSDNTPCLIFTYKGWYVIEDSVNVNRTFEELQLGVDVEMLDDYDCMTASEPITTEEDLIALVEE